MSAVEPRPLGRLSFNHLVPFSHTTPAAAFADGIELFRIAEAVGLDDGWLRTRHLQTGLGASTVYFGALSQATSRIGLGTAVTPLEFENPFRLAEDLGTADVLSGGRLQPGFSLHAPRYPDAVNDLVHDDGWRVEDYGRGRVELLRSLVSGAPVREVEAYGGIGGDFDSPRVEPQSPGLANRLWYGAGSLESVTWAGEAGFQLLLGNISSTHDGGTDFAREQSLQIDAFRAAHPLGDAARVNVSRVILPLDGATPSQVAKYREYIAGRAGRVGRVHGEKTIISTDLIGTVDELVDEIRADAAFQRADDYQVHLPFEFEFPDWKHLVETLATRLGPALGWTPATERGIG